MLVPNAAGQISLDVAEKRLQSAEQQKQLHDAMAPLMESFQALVTSADQDIASVRSAVENWYNDHMDRVSGWYKRHVAKITIVVGAILVILLNLNTISIGRALYTNSVIGSAVSTAAANHPPCSTADSACLARLQTDLSAVAQSGLPVGWATVAGCTAPHTSCNWLQERGILSPSGGAGPSAWQLILVIIGFLLTILALTPGARFWFDLLGKLGVLRSTGPKPSAPAPPTPSAVLIPPAVAAPPEQPPPPDPPPPPEPSTAPEPFPAPAG